MDDCISRSALIAELKQFKIFLGDIVFGWVVDRIIDKVKRMPAAEGQNNAKK